MLALLELVAYFNANEPLQIRQIAAKQAIPDRYLEQLLATLRRCGLVRSQRGARGGYVLSREPWKITLLEAINCIEGADAQTSEVSTDAKTLESEVVREIWQEVGKATELVLQRYTLQDLADRRDARKQVDIMYYI